MKTPLNLFYFHVIIIFSALLPVKDAPCFLLSKQLKAVQRWLKINIDYVFDVFVLSSFFSVL